MTLLERAELHAGHVAVWLAPSKIADGVVGCIRYDVPMEIRRKGVETRLVLEGDGATSAPSSIDPALTKVVARARAWFSELAEGRASSLEELGRREGLSDRYLGAIMPLAFVSPKLTREILQGRHPVDLTTDSLIKHTNLPLDWHKQNALIKFADDSVTTQGSGR